VGAHNKQRDSGLATARVGNAMTSVVGP
jgi:hypothetical protein